MGIGVGLISVSFDAQPRTRVLRTGVALNTGAGDARDISAHNSPTLVRSPTVPAFLAIANRIDTPRYSCALHVSKDGGASWRQIPLPVPRGEQPKCYAPDVAFDADGLLHVSFVTLAGRGNVPHAVWVSTLTRGRTLSAPVRALGALSFQVRLLADPNIPSRLYLTYLKANEVGLYRYARTNNPVQLVRSDDGGRTWRAPVRVSDARRARIVAPSPAIASDGRLYVAYLDLGDDRLDYEGAHAGRGGAPYGGRWSLVLSRSDDQGATWKQAVVAPHLTATERFIAFIPPFPSIAVAPRGGRLYVAFQDGGRDDVDVRLWRSSDGGEQWSTTRVNDTPRHDGTWQYRPQVAVAPNGRVDVLYYDRRADPTNVRNGVSLQSSYDDGKSFTPHTALSDRLFDSRIGQGSERGLPDLGSRLALLSTNTRALAVWPDTRAGTPATGKQDLRAAVAAFEKPVHLPVALKLALWLGTIVITLLGLALMSRWVLATASTRGPRRQGIRHGRHKQTI